MSAQCNQTKWALSLGNKISTKPQLSDFFNSCFQEIRVTNFRFFISRSQSMMKTKILQDSYFLVQTSEEKTNESYGTHVVAHSGPRERGLRAQSATTWLCIYSDKAPELPKETPENKKILHSNVLGQPGQGERRQQQARQGRQGRGTRQRWEHRGEAEMTIIIKKKLITS